MKKEDEVEAYLSTEMLKSVDGPLGPSCPYLQALMKSALALHHIFIHGRRSKIEQQFDEIGKPLSAREIADLRD
jgi:hypothetical protein